VRLDTHAFLRRPGLTTAPVVRPLTSQAEFLACVALQRRIWGEDFAEVVPASILKIATRLGGVVLGAFDAGGRLVGYVFGLTVVEHGTIVHWSHMLGVAPEAQNRGIGRQLKEHQRAAAATNGSTAISWTFDPLVARNAHLNINVLGVRVSEYVRDMYGQSTSPLHRGIGTDRLVATWPVDDAAVAKRRTEIASAFDAKWSETASIEIPGDIAALQLSDMVAAQAWRERTRVALESALARGLEVQGFRIDAKANNGHYLLAR
jgi:predicted GNAT superfamily acetyltransferase